MVVEHDGISARPSPTATVRISQVLAKDRCGLRANEQVVKFIWDVVAMMLQVSQSSILRRLYFTGWIFRPPGEVTCSLGRNGVGKTTECLMGLIPARAVSRRRDQNITIANHQRVASRLRPQGARYFRA